jgi:hypothetical protein
MPDPISSRSQWDRYDAAEANTCSAEHDAPAPARSSDVPEYLLPAGHGDGAQCGIVCGVGTAVACGGLGVATSFLLSPTVVGALAGGVLGVDCSIAATLFCAEICK